MPSSGTVLAAAMIGIGTVFGAGMWYAQQRAYYEPITDVTEVTIGNTVFTVSDYEGVDGDVTPLKLRGCFRLGDPDRAIAAGEPTETAVPLTTPDWIECFDEEVLLADIRAGRATAVMAGKDEGDGADLFMAIYGDGRAFMWRQPNDRFAK